MFIFIECRSQARSLLIKRWLLPLTRHITMATRTQGDPRGAHLQRLCFANVTYPASSASSRRERINFWTARAQADRQLLALAVSLYFALIPTRYYFTAILNVRLRNNAE